MATRYAVATGDWSALATWDGGASLPGAGDTVHANGYTVTIDQTVNVGSLRTTSGSGIAAGGGFVVASAQAITLTDSTTGLWAGTTSVLTHSATTGTSTLTATVYNNGASSGTRCVVVSGIGGRLDVIGAVQGGNGGGRVGIAITVAATVNITGDITTTNSASAAHGVDISGAATVNVVGHLSTTSSNTDRPINATAGASLSVTGSVTGGPSNTPAILWNASGTLTVVGPVTCSGAGSVAISCNSSATITITGAVTAAGGAAVALSGGATLTVTGTLTASSTGHAVESTSGSSLCIFSGPFVSGSNGWAPFYARKVELAVVASDYFRFRAPGGGTVDLVSTDSLPGLPAVDDVRSGVSFGGGALTGTCAVPAAGAVASGVAVDDTVGSALLTAADVWGVPLATAEAIADSIGERLAGAATTAQVGAIVAALGP